MVIILTIGIIRSQASKSGVVPDMRKVQRSDGRAVITVFVIADDKIRPTPKGM